jgi:hypothetical protein
MSVNQEQKMLIFKMPSAFGQKIFDTGNQQKLFMENANVINKIGKIIYNHLQ